MLKSTAIAVILTVLILMTACGGDSEPKAESNTVVNNPENLVAGRESLSPSNDENGEQDQDVTEKNQTDEANFESGLFIDMKSYQDQLNEDNAMVFAALENNLVSLVEHNNTLYRSGFVNEELADAMKYYYGEQFRYRFTDIESIEQNLPYENVHVTVIGQRLDSTTGATEDMKMLYAFRQNDQREWMIHTID
ncbi:MAG: hypothetical protein ACQEXQ_17680 [Bacillota bacterium]